MLYQLQFTVWSLHNVYVLKPWGVLLSANVTSVERVRAQELSEIVAIPAGFPIFTRLSIFNLIIVLWLKVRNCPDIGGFKTIGWSEVITLVAGICVVFTKIQALSKDSLYIYS